MLDLDTLEVYGDVRHSKVDALTKFFSNLVVTARVEGQAAVDALLWPVLSEEAGKRADENEVDEFLVALSDYSFSSEIRTSVFTSPTLEKKFVVAVIITALNKPWVTAESLRPLVERPEFDSDLFCYAMNVYVSSYTGEAVLLVELMSKLNPIPLEWLTDAYCQPYDEAFEHRIYNFEGERVVASVEDVVLAEIYPHYPELPEAWVKQMMRSMRKVKLDA